MEKEIKRILTIIVGWVLIVFGIAGLFLPFLQGILFLFMGLYLLSNEYHWAKRFLNILKGRFPVTFQKLQKIKEKPGRIIDKIFGKNKPNDKS